VGIEGDFTEKKEIYGGLDFLHPQDRRHVSEKLVTTYINRISVSLLRSVAIFDLELNMF